jgi:transglutaminase/protease-like cytokinesis protein 3
MKRGVAVCDGYAELFIALAKEAGLNIWKISGKAKGIVLHRLIININ